MAELQKPHPFSSDPALYQGYLDTFPDFETLSMDEKAARVLQTLVDGDSGLPSQITFALTKSPDGQYGVKAQFVQ